MTTKRWWLSIRGQMTGEFRAAVERTPGMAFTGLSHTTGSGGVEQESHSVYVEASTAAEAVECASAALAGQPVYVAEDTVREFPDEDD